MTWDQRLASLRFWLAFNKGLGGLLLAGLLGLAICVVVYFPFQKPSAHQGVVEGLGADDTETGRLPVLWVRLENGMTVRVPAKGRGFCQKGDRITVLHSGSLRGYTSDAAGCRRPTLSQAIGPG